MKPITQQEITDYVEANIQNFHHKRLDNLQKLRMVLKRKNPYLFKAKNINTAQDFQTIRCFSVITRRGIFGGFLRAIIIDTRGLGFKKQSESRIKQIDIVNPWTKFNNSAKSKTGITSKKRNSVSHQLCLAVCCYGKNRTPNKGDYLKLCGQQFWEFISGDNNLYTDIIEPLGHQAKEKNEQFMQEYAKVINKFTAEFIGTFCDTDGSILWEEIVKFNSAGTTS